MPFWVKFTCAVAIALGTYLGGWRIIRTLGKGLVEISAPQGLAAEASSAAIILTSSHLGLPCPPPTSPPDPSSAPASDAKGAEVRWGVAGRMGAAWLITLPSAAIVGAICWAIAHFIGGLAGVLVVFAALIAFAVFMYVRSRKEPVDAANVTAEWDEIKLCPSQIRRRPSRPPTTPERGRRECISSPTLSNRSGR